MTASVSEACDALSLAQSTLLTATERFAHRLTQLAALERRPALTAPQEQAALLAQHASALGPLLTDTADFTKAASALSSQEAAAIRPQVQALLHPTVLASPFVRRAYEKPLGYPGDYQMVRYILEDSFQGDSAYGQLINHYFLQYDVAAGHRNRITMLESRLHAEAAKAFAEGRTIRVLTIGCGPAEETYRFLRDCPHPEVVEFVLLDFSRETLDWSLARIDELQRGRERVAKVSTVEDSVYNLAKRRPDQVQAEFDLVICAGLFDYLTDRFCRRVMDYGVAALRAGGLLLVTNVSSCHSAYFMSLVMEWDLIYRTADELAALLPSGPGLSSHVELDSTGTNVIAEVRKAN